MLRVISDREVAREVARFNVSALVRGQARIVPLGARISGERLRNAIDRGRENLGVIREAVSHLMEHAAAGVDRLRRPRGPGWTPER